ncbi:uncharacterized protein HaLaN_21470 [Haematococcus lacustris]|uniref:Uncharacterized protein n=1 Tax=Haematococcus lacustris TaxID=44745 RepID=A0A6A0A2R7_HAELA|nr:uncharacterized protein HaLaN_21470 [Haematococcus lacustris]
MPSLHAVRVSGQGVVGLFHRPTRKDAIMRRDSMPGGEKWCSLYVRYHATDTAAHACRRMSAACRWLSGKHQLSGVLRRLSPSFKVAVDVRYRGAVAVPVTVKAFLLTQQQKDNILLWSHEDSNPDDKTTDKAS